MNEMISITCEKKIQRRINKHVVKLYSYLLNMEEKFIDVLVDFIFIQNLKEFSNT